MVKSQNLAIVTLGLPLHEFAGRLIVCIGCGRQVPTVQEYLVAAVTH
jgi:hypothetical protein